MEEVSGRFRGVFALGGKVAATDRPIRLLAVYLFAVYALRTFLFPGLSEDDAEQIFYAQSLAGASAMES